MLERTLCRKARWKNHHVFSLRCRDEGIIPASLRVRTPVRTREGYRIAERASRAFLSARIQQSHSNKVSLEKKSAELETSLRHSLSVEDHHLIDELCIQSAEREFCRTKKRHLDKLD